VAKRKRYEAKPERSSRRDERRELMVKAKSVWENLRPKATGKEKSQKLVAQLLELLKGRIVEFVFRHDGSRIVQWLLAEGTPQQKGVVLDELEKGAEKKRMPGDAPFFVRLASDRYGKHLAVKLMRTTSDKKRRALVFENYLRGNVAALMRTSSGADTLDVAFQTVVSAKQRARLVVEFLFSKEKKLFEVIQAKKSKHDKEDDGGGVVWNFEQCLPLLGVEFKKQILEAAAATLSNIIDKDACLRMNIVHCALKDYLEVVMKTDDIPAATTQEITGLLAPSIVHLTHTKAGAHVAVTCIKVLDAKHRKKAARGLKGHIRQIIEDEYGHKVILALLEWVDDTKLIGGIVFTEIFSKSKLALENKQTRYFNPDIYAHVWDNVSEEKFGKMSKKNPENRAEELRTRIRAPVKELLKEHTLEIICATFSAPIIIGAVNDGELRSGAAQHVGKILENEDGRAALLGNTCGRKTLATLFKIGTQTFADQVVDVCGPDIAVHLAMDENCIGAARNLLMATENTQTSRAIIKAKKSIEEKHKDNKRGGDVVKDVLKRAEMLTSFDSVVGAL